MISAPMIVQVTPLPDLVVVSLLAFVPEADVVTIYEAEDLALERTLNAAEALEIDLAEAGLF